MKESLKGNLNKTISEWVSQQQWQVADNLKPKYAIDWQL